VWVREIFSPPDKNSQRRWYQKVRRGNTEIARDEQKKKGTIPLQAKAMRHEFIAH
jgi:hypothetical protein